MAKTSLKHNQLQYQCHQWLWNEHPELRYLSHANINNLTTETPDARFKMAKLKSIGLVKGVLDYELYYRKTLYVFDFKVGHDKLSKEQKEFINKIEENGGKAYEIRDLETFKEIIWKILKKKKKQEKKNSENG